MRLLSVDTSRVSARQPRYFLLLRQNKVSKEKATEASLPLTGFPLLQVKKWEIPETRFAETRVFLHPFSASHQRHRHIGIRRQNQLQSNCNVIATDIYISQGLSYTSLQ